MMRSFRDSVVFKRLLWTLFFVFIYVFGSHLPLPFVNLEDPRFLGGPTGVLAFSSSLMGGNLGSLSLFAVGLSPWMSAMILWQMFALSKPLGLNKLPIEAQDRRRMYLTLAIALIQSLVVTLNLPLLAGVNVPLVLLMNTLILIAGSFFLVWLSDLNSRMGIGGSIVILMASMVSSLPQQILSSIYRLQIGWELILPLIVLGLLFLYLSVIVYRARYRIPINKVNIHNRYQQYAYLDIMVNPSGGMPFMYAMSLVSVPQYVLILIGLLFPTNGWTQGLIEDFGTGRPQWLILYLITLFLLGIAFSFVNVSGQQIAERMRKSGEYIYEVYPGPDTARYINQLVFRFALVGAVYTVVMAGGPMLLILLNPQYLQLSMIPGMFLIFSGMIFNVREEIAALRLNETYTGLFEDQA